MAKGKATKRKRATQRRAPARAVQSKRAARRPKAGDRRVWVLGAVIAAIVVAVLVGAVLSRGDEGSSVDAGPLPGTEQAVPVFAGIPQAGVVLGPPDAPVTLVEFIDLQCPFCRDFALHSVPAIVEKHVRTGKVRYELRALAFLGPDSERGLRAVLAAARQDRMFELTELLFYNQGPENTGWLTEDLVEAAAGSLPGVDVARLLEDMDSSAVSKLIEEHADEAERRGVRGTPSIFVGPTGGELKRVQLESVTDVAPVDEAIAAASS
jgi:protein-disulfide isomerase